MVTWTVESIIVSWNYQFCSVLWFNLYKCCLITQDNALIFKKQNLSIKGRSALRKV